MQVDLGAALFGELFRLPDHHVAQGYEEEGEEEPTQDVFCHDRVSPAFFGPPVWWRLGYEDKGAEIEGIFERSFYDEFSVPKSFEGSCKGARSKPCRKKERPCDCVLLGGTPDPPQDLKRSQAQ